MTAAPLVPRLRTAADFPRWLCATLDALGVRAKPATKKQLAMRLPATRDGSGAAPMPPSLLDALSVHGGLEVAGKRLLRFPSRGGMRSERIAPFIAQLVGAPEPKRFDELWSESAESPALVELCHGFNQPLFLYVASPDRAGEYAIVAYDDQPELFLRYASVRHLVCTTLLEEATGLVEPFDADKVFAKPMAAARRRLAKALKAEHYVETEAIVAAEIFAPGASVVEPASRRTLKQSVRALRAFQKRDPYQLASQAEANQLFADLVAFGADARKDLVAVLAKAAFPAAAVAASALFAIADALGDPELASSVLVAVERRGEVFSKHEWTWCPAEAKAWRKRAAELLMAGMVECLNVGVVPHYHLFLIPQRCRPKVIKVLARRYVDEIISRELGESFVASIELPEFEGHLDSRRRGQLRAYWARSAALRSVAQKSPREFVFALQEISQGAPVDEALRGDLQAAAELAIPLLSSAEAMVYQEFIEWRSGDKRVRRLFPELHKRLAAVGNAGRSLGPRIDKLLRLAEAGRATPLEVKQVIAAIRPSLSQLDPLQCSNLLSVAWELKDDDAEGAANLFELVFDVDEASRDRYLSVYLDTCARAVPERMRAMRDKALEAGQSMKTHVAVAGCHVALGEHDEALAVLGNVKKLVKKGAFDYLTPVKKDKRFVVLRKVPGFRKLFS